MSIRIEQWDPSDQAGVRACADVWAAVTRHDDPGGPSMGPRRMALYATPIVLACGLVSWIAIEKPSRMYMPLEYRLTGVSINRSRLANDTISSNFDRTSSTPSLCATALIGDRPESCDWDVWG